MAENGSPLPTPACIVDTSFVLSFLLPDEGKTIAHPTFEKYASGEISLYSGPPLPYEVLNALRSSVLRKRVNHKVAIELAKAFSDLSIVIKEVDAGKSLELALEHRISVYDATFLILAVDSRAPFLTLDAKLKKLATSLKIPTHLD